MRTELIWSYLTVWITPAGQWLFFHVYSIRLSWFPCWISKILWQKTHPTAHQEISHYAPFCNRNGHISVTKWCTVGYGWCIVGFFNYINKCTMGCTLMGQHKWNVTPISTFKLGLFWVNPSLENMINWKLPVLHGPAGFLCLFLCLWLNFLYHFVNECESIEGYEWAISDCDAIWCSIPAILELFQATRSRWQRWQMKCDNKYIYTIWCICCLLNLKQIHPSHTTVVTGVDIRSWRSVCVVVLHWLLRFTIQGI